MSLLGSSLQDWFVSDFHILTGKWGGGYVKGGSLGLDTVNIIEEVFNSLLRIFNHLCA
jgi:hypothetical protein